MYPASLKSIESPTVRARIAVERRIVRSLLNEFADQGFTFRVDDGEADYTCKTKQEALKHLMETDEDRLVIFKAGIPQGEHEH